MLVLLSLGTVSQACGPVVRGLWSGSVCSELPSVRRQIWGETVLFPVSVGLALAMPSSPLALLSTPPAESP